MGSFTALLDASVLYSAPLRDLLLELAVSDLYRAKWSNAINDEWINALLSNRSDLTRKQLERTRDLMNTHVRDALVEGYEDLVEIVRLPDPGDRHVVAAAIKGRADVVVTANVRDFPASSLQRWDLEVQHPDEFLQHHFHLSPSTFLAAARRVRLRLKQPPVTIDEYLQTLEAHGLVATVGELTPFREFM